MIFCHLKYFQNGKVSMVNTDLENLMYYLVSVYLNNYYKFLTQITLSLNKFYKFWIKILQFQELC
jgi:hypothetical protein